MIAENGQLAIHLPLTAARISAFSTHTAHPEFVYNMSKILQTALSYDIRIQNPYLYMTKAEVVAAALSNDHDVIERTISCWRSARLPANQTHCGFCVPCLIRRIANEFNGILLNEYGRDIFSEHIALLPADDDAKRNFVELAEFVRFFEQALSPAELLAEYPDLVNEHIDAMQAIAMYHRFAQEARTVFNRYPHLSSLVA
jgi:7-cyano-7-deazaguanine synthase in queuosine biosynthesis